MRESAHVLCGVEWGNGKQENEKKKKNNQAASKRLKVRKCSTCYGHGVNTIFLWHREG